MKVVTFGVFDYFHYGHLKLFERARALGDYLIVAVQKTEEINKNKPDASVLYSLEQRMEILRAIRFIDEVVSYSQVDVDVKSIDFDILAIGGDQNHEGFQNAIKWAQEHEKQVIVLNRTPNISSSGIKTDLS